uniref:Uncharacterized protein n=1 Tax=Glossina pallidipes TaxID=7398 RepID=A0A1A9ZVU5_GLOPL
MDNIQTLNYGQLEDTIFYGNLYALCNESSSSKTDFGLQPTYPNYFTNSTLNQDCFKYLEVDVKFDDFLIFFIAIIIIIISTIVDAITSNVIDKTTAIIIDLYFLMRRIA